MNRLRKEQGYALLIVLFAIVFITVLTAVFMRGAISNARQSQTIDKNNLVVVSAESGVDYYTWHLKELYDEKQLEAEFNTLVNGYVAAEKPVNYKAIQRTIVDNFKTKLETEAAELTDARETDLFSQYSHELTAASVKEEAAGDNIYLLVTGIVQGKVPAEEKEKTKDLTFELRYIFPEVLTAGGPAPDKPDDEGNGSLISMPVLKTPISPSDPFLPQKPSTIKQPNTPCPTETERLQGKSCYFNNLHIANYNVNKSVLFVEDYLTSWQKIDIANSSAVYVKNHLEAANTKIEKTNLMVGANLKGNSSLHINEATVSAGSSSNSADLQISNSNISFTNGVTAQKNHIQSTSMVVGNFNGGNTTFNEVDFTTQSKFEVQDAKIENSRIQADTYKAHTSATFMNTDMFVNKTYSSGGVNFSNSKIEIGQTMNSGGGLFYTAGSDVLIRGDAHTANGSTIKNSVIRIVGYFLHTSKPLDAENSDIYVGGKVTATNGTDFKQVNMIVKGEYESSTRFKLQKTKLAISKSLALGNGGELENSVLTGDRITSNTTLKLKGSIAAANYLKSDVMRMENSSVCAKELSVRALWMDSDSKIYYQNQTSNSVHTNQNIIKLSPEKYEKKCAIPSDDTPNPTLPQGTIDWKAPVVDKVTY